jgi:hypothetical protein
MKMKTCVCGEPISFVDGIAYHWVEKKIKLVEKCEQEFVRDGDATGT